MVTWKPVDTEFFAPRSPVEIVSVGWGVGGLDRLTRDLIEQLGGTAHLHLCGTPGDFLKVISQGENAAPYLIVLAHGADEGLVFGEYADSIDTGMLVKGRMPPECIAEHINLPGRVVFSDACGAGEVPMAQAFMAGGRMHRSGHLRNTANCTRKAIATVPCWWTGAPSPSQASGRARSRSGR